MVLCHRECWIAVLVSFSRGASCIGGKTMQLKWKEAAK